MDIRCCEDKCTKFASERQQGDPNWKWYCWECWCKKEGKFAREWHRG